MHALYSLLKTWEYFTNTVIMSIKFEIDSKIVCGRLDISAKYILYLSISMTVPNFNVSTMLLKNALFHKLSEQHSFTSNYVYISKYLSTKRNYPATTFSNSTASMGSSKGLPPK